MVGGFKTFCLSKQVFVFEIKYLSFYILVIAVFGFFHLTGGSVNSLQSIGLLMYLNYIKTSHLFCNQLPGTQETECIMPHGTVCFWYPCYPTELLLFRV